MSQWNLQSLWFLLLIAAKGGTATDDQALRGGTNPCTAQTTGTHTGSDAKQLGLSTSYLNQLENDQRPLTVTVLMQLAQRFNLDPGYFANDRDARTITDLRRIFPEATEDSLADLASRFPELMPRFVDVASRAPARERSPFELVRDFFYDAHNYIHELDVLAEELAGQLGDRVLRRGRLASHMHEDLGVTVRFSLSLIHI